MADYKELYYESQAKIADMIEKLEEMTEELKKLMRENEEKIISEDLGKK